MDKTFCKLCLQNNSILISVFQEDCGESLNISTVIKNHFPSADTNINFICTECWNKLKDFHLFYLYINEIHESMQESHAFAINMQTEPDIEYIKLENAYVLLTDCMKDIKKEDDIQDDISEDIKCNISISEFNDDNDIDYTNEDDYVESPPISKTKIVVKRKLSTKKKRKKSSIKIEKKPKDTKPTIKKVQDHELLKEYCNMMCDLCSTTFEENGLLEARKHYQEVHNKKGYLRCCKKKFFKRVHLLNHIDRHRNPEVFYKCKECNRKYVAEKALERHVLMRHSPMETWKYICEVCHKRFSNAASLETHSYLHVPEHEKKFICDICNKAYPTNKHLLSHKNIHINLELICEICARICKNKYSLQNHMREHTDKEPDREQCNECGKWYANVRSLTKHKMRMHTSYNGEFKCEHCDKVYTYKDALTRHSAYTHGEKKHKCTLCDKSFRRHLALKEHLAVHTGEDLYTCQFCSQTFKSSANMYAHRKKVHVEEYLQLQNSSH